MADIGNWVRRKGKWHLVESVVAEDAITRCGRRMDRVTRSGGELEVSEVMPLTRMIGQPQLCKAGCERQGNEDAEDTAALEQEIAANAGRPLSDFTPLADFIAEDDASTQPETVP